MTNQPLKAVLITILVATVFSISLNHQQQSTLPTDSYGTYQDTNCCPAGYNVAG
jgi:hypothetical protein